MSHTAIVLVALLAAFNCSLLGVFLLLRRQLMVGDAVAHAVLPGVVVAFYWTQQLASYWITLGGVLAAVCAMAVIHLLRAARLPRGTAIGVGAAAFFALGVVLLAQYADSVDLDPACVLFGDLISSFFNRTVVLGVSFPVRLYPLVGLLLLNGLFLYCVYPALVVDSFDGAFAASVGIRTRLLGQAFLLLTAVNVVVVFRIVGVPLVVGLLAIPAATAYLFAGSLRAMVLYAFAVDTVMVVYGYIVAYSCTVSLTGATIVVGGVVFALALLLSARRVDVLRRFLEKGAGKGKKA